MKKKVLIPGVIIAVTLIIILIAVFVFLRGPEDNWIRDANGVWIPHGQPDLENIPPKVLEQQAAIVGAEELYNAIRIDDERYEGDCLGTVGNYSVDMVHVPRTGEDNQAKNQCADYLNKVTPYFIELDKDGNIVRVVD